MCKCKFEWAIERDVYMRVCLCAGVWDVLRVRWNLILNEFNADPQGHLKPLKKSQSQMEWGLGLSAMTWIQQ